MDSSLLVVCSRRRAALRGTAGAFRGGLVRRVDPLTQCYLELALLQKRGEMQDWKDQEEVVVIMAVVAEEALVVHGVPLLVEISSGEVFGGLWRQTCW